MGGALRAEEAEDAIDGRRREERGRRSEKRRLREREPNEEWEVLTCGGRSGEETRRQRGGAVGLRVQRSGWWMCSSEEVDLTV
jgi:hypothetical protein